MIVSRRSLLVASAALGGGLAATTRPAHAAPQINAAAPAFTGVDSNGVAVRLAELRGKLVVLEWTNDGCPFVGKWYRSGAMQQLQRDATGLGATWLTIISSAPGEQGYADGPRANALTAQRSAAPAHVLLDPKGEIGRAYNATTTPEIFVIRSDGVLAYMGGADSIASTRVEDMARATPHARDAITAIAAGRPAPNPVTRPYGCDVKYAA